MRALTISKPALSTIIILLLCAAANALQGTSSPADLSAGDLDAIVSASSRRSVLSERRC